MTIGGFVIRADDLALGVTIGATYGILAVGMVLVYRVSRVLNFAHGAIGAFGAAVLGSLVVSYSVPYWLAFPLAIAVSALIGAGGETIIVRRLRNAPRVLSLVATLGFAALVTSYEPIVYGDLDTSVLYPQPPGLPRFHIGAFFVTPAHTAMLIGSPILVTALAVFLRRSRFGLALRAAAANPEAAFMSGVYATRMSTIAWAISGGLAGFAAILIFPVRGFSGGVDFGPDLLLRALGAAVVARMESLPIALLAGIGIGVAETEITANVTEGQIASLLIFGVILVGLVVQRRGAFREVERGTWATIQGLAPLPDAYRAVRSIIWLPRVLQGIALGFLVTLPLWASNATSIGMADILAFGIIALSVGLFTGQAGHLSLGQFAFAGIGAAVSLHVEHATSNHVIGALAGGSTAACVSVVIGLPALRIRGVMFAVTTLAFGFAAQSYLLSRSWLLGTAALFDRPTIGPWTLDSGHGFYLYALTASLLMLVLVANVRRSALGRCLAALRDNEPAARAFTVRAGWRTLQLFAIAGFVAGVGGAVLADGLGQVDPSRFTNVLSIDTVAAAAIGGLQLVAGPLLGAMYIAGIPQFVPLDSAALAGSAFGWLFLLLYFPGGLAQIIGRTRVRVYDWLAARAGVEDVRLEGDEQTASMASQVGAIRTLGAVEVTPAERSGRPLLEADGLSRSFGGVRAVNGVGLTAARGEILGLIGPNGAGKSTLFDLLTGFISAESGRVVLDGRDVSRLGPEARGRLGMLRSFQDSALFPTLTVLDTVMLATERSEPAAMVDALTGARAADRRREAAAREVISSMGLDRYRNRRVAELSTGTRRITELTCMVALRPRVILLDEPSTGIAQRESEALADLLLRLRDHLGATMVIVEHDMPLIMGIADRIMAMEAGSILAVGAPAEIAKDPRVVASYLGGDTTTIERSGGRTVPAPSLRAAGAHV